MNQNIVQYLRENKLSEDQQKRLDNGLRIVTVLSLFSTFFIILSGGFLFFPVSIFLAVLFVFLYAKNFEDIPQAKGMLFRRVGIVFITPILFFLLCFGMCFGIAAVPSQFGVPLLVFFFALLFFLIFYKIFHPNKKT